MLKRRLSLLGILILITMVLASGATFAWRYIGSNGTSEISFGTKKIEASLEFETVTKITGIPGEEMPISTKNIIHKNSGTDEMVFKVSYKISSPVMQDIISKMEVRDGDADIIWIKDSKNSTNSELIYYGSIKGDQKVSKNLGTLFIEYKFNGNEVSSLNFDINTTFLACQRTESAIKELLGVNPVGEYAILIN